MLSVIIPAYNEELTIEKTYGKIYEVLRSAHIHNEIIFVDDGSKDRTYEKIKGLTDISENVRGLHFSRNFGKEAAISAGLASAAGECAVVIDCDLQHPPEKIVDMYRLWQQGYEIVEGVKKSRGDEGTAYGWGARVFYSVISSVIGADMSNASDFKLLDRKVIDILNKIPERKGFFRAISFWVGYNKATVEFDVAKRVGGSSKWSAKGLIRYAVSNFSAYSTSPMQIVTVLGVIMLGIVCFFGVRIFIDRLCGRAACIAPVIVVTMFVGSIIMISLGIIGYYVARIYDEIKGRPKYIISASCQSEKK